MPSHGGGSYTRRAPAFGQADCKLRPEMPTNVAAGRNKRSFKKSFRETPSPTVNLVISVYFLLRVDLQETLKREVEKV